MGKNPDRTTPEYFHESKCKVTKRNKEIYDQKHSRLNVDVFWPEYGEA